MARAHPQHASGKAAPLAFGRSIAKTLASQQISQDIARFNRAGGHIEVLGITRVLTHIDGGTTRKPAHAWRAYAAHDA